MIRKINLEQSIVVASVSTNKLSTQYSKPDSLEVGISGYTPPVRSPSYFDYGDPTYFATPAEYVING